MLEAFPVEQNGQRMIALRDPAGFTEQVAVLPLPLLDLVSLFDGEHSVARIEEIIRTRHGEGPTAEQIGNLVESLDEAGFLESERFKARREAIDEKFRQSPVRPAAHAGGAYAGEPAALAKQIDAFFTDPEGPGKPAEAVGNGSLRGLIAPHIDFHRGGPVYGWAYRTLLEQSSADLFVVLGTCHAGMADPFSITLKPYDTPFGAVPVDRAFCEALDRRAGGDPRVPRFIDALLGTMATSRRTVCVIAGVDLAHMGPRFGDPEANTPEGLAAVRTADLSMLEAITAGDPTAFYASVA